MGRKKVRKLKNEHQLAQEAKNNQHKRNERLREGVNIVACVAVFVVPGLLVLAGIVLAIHDIITNDWSSFANILGQGVTLVIGYAIKYFQDNIFNNEDKK